MAVRDGQQTGATGLLHRMFDVVVIVKGLDGVLEIAGGISLLFIKSGAIAALVKVIIARELSEDPQDLFANLLRHWAESFGQSTQTFAAAYLLSHGITKVALATFLLRGKIWAYPVALIFISVFVAYMAFRLSIGWSWLLAGLVVLDLITLWLIAGEWRATSATRQRPRR
jgi:uncharacterized membrane protein